MEFNATKQELDTIVEIAKRAVSLAAKHDHDINRTTVIMDVDACHSNGCKIRLAELLAADDANFAHDVFGIMRHINRDTGKLGDCFTPRFADLRPSATSLVNLSACNP